jgi:hypothetical protein
MLPPAAGSGLNSKQVVPEVIVPDVRVIPLPLQLIDLQRRQYPQSSRFAQLYIDCQH